jgi:hypothetical protein
MWGNVPPADRMQRLWRALRDDFVPTPAKIVQPEHFTEGPLKRGQPIQGHARAGVYPFLERMEVTAKLGDHAALLRDIKAMFLPMAETAPGTLWEDPMTEIALCHSIGCGVGGILTEDILGIRFGSPIQITPHSGGTLQWCHGYLTSPQGRIEVGWQSQRNRYELQATLPNAATAEVFLPPEAKAVWQSAPAITSWQDSIKIGPHAVITVEPGRLTVK